jgi:hypothetical protein
MPEGLDGPKLFGHALPDAETAERRLIAVAEAALAAPGRLNMARWHPTDSRCKTVHCIGGWAVHNEGEAGYALEREVGQPAAGTILLGIKASHLFYLGNDEARSALFKVLKDAGRPLPAL